MPEVLLLGAIFIEEIAQILIGELLKLFIFIIGQLMVLAVAVAHVHFIALSVQPYVGTNWARECKVAGIIFFNFFIYFLFKFNQFFLNFVIDMPLIIQEVM